MEGRQISHRLVTGCRGCKTHDRPLSPRLRVRPPTHGSGRVRTPEALKPIAPGRAKHAPGEKGVPFGIRTPEGCEDSGICNPCRVRRHLEFPGPGVASHPVSASTPPAYPRCTTPDSRRRSLRSHLSSTTKHPDRDRLFRTRTRSRSRSRCRCRCRCRRVRQGQPTRLLVIPALSVRHVADVNPSRVPHRGPRPEGATQASPGQRPAVCPHPTTPKP
jgi:hypothetical protein